MRINSIRNLNVNELSVCNKMTLPYILAQYAASKRGILKVCTKVSHYNYEFDVILTVHHR